jgi:hypothetical protein
MWRKSLWFSVAILATVGGGILAGLVAMTQHVPAFYLRAAAPPGQQQKTLSHHFQSKAAQLMNHVTADYPKEERWTNSFTEAELNAFFAEDFLSNLEGLPAGASDLRVEIDSDRLRLGFRYGGSAWSTIVSIDFRIWLAKGQRNVVVLQLIGLHAGSLPISSQSLLEDISTYLSSKGVQVTWYRHQGHPTAILKIQSDQNQASALLQQIDLQPGIITIVGQSAGPR